MTRFLFPLLILFLSLACKQKEASQSKELNPATGSYSADTLSKVSNDFLVEMDQLLVDAPLLQQKLAPKLGISKEPTPNRHYPEEIDTFMVLSFKSSEIRIYKKEKPLFCTRAVIQDPEVPLPQGLKVGMDQSAFMERMGFDQKARIYELAEGEGFSRCYFTFMRDELFRVDYLPYWD